MGPHNGYKCKMVSVDPKNLKNQTKPSKLFGLVRVIRSDWVESDQIQF